MFGNAALDPFAGAEPPAKCQHGRCNAERDYVGNGIELQTKITCRLGQAGNTAVKAVEYVTYTDENSSVIPVPAQRRDYRVIAAENVSNCKETGDDRKARLKSRTIADTPLWPSSQH